MLQGGHSPGNRINDCIAVNVVEKTMDWKLILCVCVRVSLSLSLCVCTSTQGVGKCALVCICIWRPEFGIGFLPYPVYFLR